MADPIKVDIWSDIACPWCFIGKRKFEEGARRFGGDVEIEFHSFELSPDTPVDFEGSTTEYLAERKGMPTEQVEQMLGHVTGIAESVGLHYDFDAVKHTNTVKAHQLIHYAKAHGRQSEMKERLLKAYFEEGRHLGHADELIEIATELGFDHADVTEALETGRYLQDVRADQQQAIAYGIQGVPFFVLDGKYGVSGAQDPEVFANVLNQVAAERVSEPTS